MRVLLLHPEDSPLNGPWAGQKWDLIIDLGRSSPFTGETWSTQCGCKVMRSDLYNRGISDVRSLRQFFSIGKGHLIDEAGIDWWDLLFLLVASEALTALTFIRLANQIDSRAELWTTRTVWPASALAILGKRRLKS